MVSKEPPDLEDSLGVKGPRARWGRQDHRELEGLLEDLGRALQGDRGHHRVNDRVPQGIPVNVEYVAVSGSVETMESLDKEAGKDLRVFRGLREEKERRGVLEKPEPLV